MLPLIVLVATLVAAGLSLINQNTENKTIESLVNAGTHAIGILGGAFAGHSPNQSSKQLYEALRPVSSIGIITLPRSLTVTATPLHRKLRA
jgi:hypothetical protein